MKKFFIALLIITMIFATTSCKKNKTETNSPKYNYTVAEKIKTDSYFDDEFLFNKKPNVTYITENLGVEGYLIEGMPYGDKTSSAFFWLGKPEGTAPDGGWPAVILIHGGGGNAYSDWVNFWTKKGYVALALDISGQMYDENINLIKNKDFLCMGSWGSIGCQADEASFKKSWTYMNVCNTILSHNYLRSLDYVNCNKTVITGISWGAFLTCIVSGIDKRFQAFAPVYGCGLDGDSWGLNTAGLIGLSEQKRIEWKNTYDPSAYLPYCTKPILFVSGATDHAFSPVSHKKSTADIPGKVFFNYSSSLAHGHYWQQTPCVELFFDHILNDTIPLINFLTASCKNGIISFEVESDIESVCLAYTTSTDPDSHNWTWTNTEFSAHKGINTITLPEGTTAATIVGYNDSYNYSIASTDFFFPNGISNLI